MPGSSRAGRMLAKVSNILRSVTFALLPPSPIGVASGPLSTTRVRSIESSVSSGTPLTMPRSNARPPASANSHCSETPVASMSMSAAPTTSGPTPSPSITVTAGAVSF